jgi:predicted TIM-barrel fold metal-dependent hydrolase
VAEAERCIAKGFRTLMLPCSYPWRPYDRRDYTPLWSLVEASGVVLNFHVFTGNVFFGTDFASVDGMSVEEFAMRRESARVIEDRMERLSTTVIGMAAGMGPIVHLTGGGVLERHPRLKFVVTEAEAGLAGVDTACDGRDAASAPPRLEYVVDARQRLLSSAGRGNDHRRSDRVE